MQDSQGLDSPTSSLPNPTNGDEPCSPTIGPESPSTTTCETLALSENQRGELVLTEYAHQLTTGGAGRGRGFHA